MGPVGKLFEHLLVVRHAQCVMCTTCDKWLSIVDFMLHDHARDDKLTTITHPTHMLRLSRALQPRLYRYTPNLKVVWCRASIATNAERQLEANPLREAATGRRVGQGAGASTGTESRLLFASAAGCHGWTGSYLLIGQMYKAWQSKHAALEQARQYRQRPAPPTPVQQRQRTLIANGELLDLSSANPIMAHILQIRKDSQEVGDACA